MKATALLIVGVLLTGCGPREQVSQEATAVEPVPAQVASPPAGAPARASTPASADEDIRAAVTRGRQAASGSMAAVAEFYANRGEFPATCGEIGDACEDEVTIQEGGIVSVDLGATGVAELANTTITLTPSVDENGDIRFACTSNVPAAYAPGRCNSADQPPSPMQASTGPTVLDLQLEPAKYYGQAITLDCVVDFAALGGGLTAGKCRVSSGDSLHIDTEQFNADQMRTLIQDCRDGCRARVTGTFTRHEMWGDVISDVNIVRL